MHGRIGEVVVVEVALAFVVGRNSGSPKSEYMLRGSIGGIAAITDGAQLPCLFRRRVGGIAKDPHAHSRNGRRPVDAVLETALTPRWTKRVSRTRRAAFTGGEATLFRNP